ncbi:hypothetical protein PENTCL1PPCAC_2690, partial [Pristionchus entomophagus]
FRMAETVVSANSLDALTAGSLREEQIKEESDDEAPAEVSSKMDTFPDDNGVKEDESDDEEAAILAKAKAEEAARRAASNKCDVCGENEKKYRCPKCDARSCSLACSKKHKEEDKCDGVRGPWQPVAKVSRFNEQRVNEDSRFLNQVVSGVRDTLVGNQKMKQETKTEQSDELVPIVAPEGDHPQPEEGALHVPAIPIPVIPECLPEGLREQAASSPERFLIGACHKRKVFIYFNEEKGQDDASRHEQFSDTVFWAVTLEFRKEIKNEEGEGTGQFTSYHYTVQQVPETICVRTVIKQFLKPRVHGCLVSKEELDTEKLQPFIDATAPLEGQPWTAENINVFMPAYLRGEDKYYTVNSEAAFLDNLRQRVVVNHPSLVVCLQSELPSMTVISEEEQRMVAEARRQIRDQRVASAPRGGGRGAGGGGGFRGNNFRGGPSGFHQHGGRGGGGGGFGGFGGGGRGRGGGGGFRGGNKRPFEGGDRGGYGKRGRGDRGGGRGGGRHQYRNRDLDDFDPFEPFAGPVGAAMLESWNSSVAKTEPDNSGAGGSGAKNYFPSLDSLVGSSPNKN